MTRSSASSATVELIKGYLPVRLRITNDSSSTGDVNTNDETFFFVKEHRDNAANNAKISDNQFKTLFVANAPVVPSVPTRMLLQSLLGQFVDPAAIVRVTVIPNPRHTSQKNPDQDLVSVSSATPSFLPTIVSEGKFAHVVFATPKDMKRTLKQLTKIMSSENPALTLEKVEIQTMADQAILLQQQQEKNERRTSSSHGHDDDDEENLLASRHEEANNLGKSAVSILAARYRASMQRFLNHDALLEECNAVMETFETAEEEDRRARAAAAQEPDADGFVTVSYTSQVGSKRELEQDETGRRRSNSKRSRNSKKKKKSSGATEGLSDFYRFQTKEKRKQSLQELRKRFEDDLAKVQKMKEEKKFQPF